MSKSLRFICLCLFLFLPAALGWAVDQAGSLSGAVMEEGGAGLPGVKVTVAGPSLMGTRSAVTDANGHFRLGNLNVGGSFTVTFALEGFQSVERKNVRIELGKDTYLSQMLALGQIREAVVVTGAIPIMDPKSSSTQLNISKEIVETMANDRQYQTIMEMMPGAIPGNNPAMMGASDSDNMYQFDGMESTDPLTKTWSTAMNFDNFEEMQVVAQGAPAEYGRGTGAVINVVTKSGSNELHGTARLSVSKTDWNTEAKDYNFNYSDPTRFLNEMRPSLNLGGPIVKDHLWFFASWERRNKWKPASWYTSAAEAAAQEPSGSGKGYYKGHYASGKLTLRFNALTVMGMWSEDPIDIPDYFKYQNNPSFANECDVKQNQGGWNLNTEATLTIGPSTFLTGRFSVKRGELNILANTMTGPMYEQNGYYWGAGLYDYRTKRNHNQYVLNLNHFMDTAIGYHDIKAGVELYHEAVAAAKNSTYPGGEYIRYSPTGLTWRRYVYETDVPKQAWEYGDVTTLFLQDKWEITRGLTLNLGLRLEQQAYQNMEKTEVLKFTLGETLAPRLGLAYAFGKNKLTANWGRYFDMYGWWVVDNLQPDVFARTYDYYRGRAYGFPDWTYIGTYYATAPSSEVEVADLKPQFMDEFGVGFERALGSKLALSLSYMHRAWKQKIEDYDHEGLNIWSFANESDFHSQDVSWGKTFRKYDAAMVTLKKNLGDDRFQFLASYTWSKLKGFDADDGETTWGDHPFMYLNSLSYLPNDTRHQIRFNGSYVFPLDIIVGVNVFWFSGMPVFDGNGVSVNADMLYQDGGATHFDGQYLNTRIANEAAAERMPPQSRVDLRVEKKFEFKKLFSISVYADVFNLLDRQSALYRDTYLGEGYFTGVPGSSQYVLDVTNPTYNQVTSWTAPRSFFFGVKVEW